MPKFICLFCFLLILNSSLAQQALKRKGSLGIDFEPASKELMQSLRVLETHGIVVKNVFPQSTAERLGIRANDVIVALNQKDSLFLYDFVQESNRLYENDPISITIVRERYKNRLVGTVAASPKETAPIGEVSYDDVDYLRGKLRSIINKPNNNDKQPTIFFFQNYDCTSIDFSRQPKHPIKQLIDGWVKAGYVVFRLEKPGVGESENTKDCSRTNFVDELKAFELGFAKLKKYSFVDSTKISFFGYGMGGIVAPLVAAKANGAKPAGIMTYGTVVKPWFEHSIDALRKRSAMLGESQQSIEANTRMLTPLLYDWLIANKTPNELMEDPDYEAILTSKENPLSYVNGTFYGKSPTYFNQLNKQNIVQAWAQAGVPTLAIHGEFDLQDLNDEAAKNIVAIVNEVKPQNATFKSLKGSDQNFVKFSSFDEYLKIMNLPNYTNEIAPQSFNNEVIEITVNWLKNR